MKAYPVLHEREGHIVQVPADLDEGNAERIECPGHLILQNLVGLRLGKAKGSLAIGLL